MTVVLAAVLLRQGNSPPDVAHATRVPLALVELLEEHLDPPHPTTNPTAPDPAHRPDPPRAGQTVPPADHATGTSSPPDSDEPARTAAARRPSITLVGRGFRWTVRGLRVLLLLNAALAATAAVTHAHRIAEASLIAVPVSFAALGLLWLHSRPRPGGLAP